jgi:hypothetical protein
MAPGGPYASWTGMCTGCMAAPVEMRVDVNAFAPAVVQSAAAASSAMVILDVMESPLAVPVDEHSVRAGP